jgi:hypothetical protein
MEKRQIKMPDGRYLIFYTFGNEHAPSNAKANQEAAASDSEPEAKPEAEEERRV